MIDKLLRRFCATEVQILIKKVETDYADMRSNSIWMTLVEDRVQMTLIERACMGRALNRARKNYKRNVFLAAIMKQQLNPQASEGDMLSSGAWREQVQHQADMKRYVLLQQDQMRNERNQVQNYRI